MKSIAIETIRNERDNFIDLAQKMWHEPEIAYNEVKTCGWTADLLRHYGFAVEVGYAGLPTCVVGRWGSGSPVIGFLGELDALPGLSQKVSTQKEPVTPGGNGQGCGHNLLNTACLAGAVGLKAEMEARNLPGTVIFYGCPAEEVLTGKVFMARNGAFRELDVAFAWHGGRMHDVPLSVMNGLNSAIFHFHGRTAHAGGDPYNGRSALDAAELMSVGANYLREHVTSDIRIHYSYKEAGTAPNIVPDKASVWYYVRGQSRPAIEDAYDRLVKVATGAAIMTETEVEVEFLGGCYNTMPNAHLGEIVRDMMKEIGPPTYTQEELDFAETLNEKSPMFESSKTSGMLNNGPINNGIAPIKTGVGGGGSTDVGDVQHLVPCVFLNTTTYNAAAPGHSWQVTACAGNSIGHKGMLFGAEVMADSAIKLIENPDHIAKAKAEFDESMKGAAYKCPIPAETPIPMPAAR